MLTAAPGLFQNLASMLEIPFIKES